MEDCCVVCAEPLEWVAYGPCGHREVCFACVARLRVVVEDTLCCICKQDCPTVFVTKALGDYTRVLTDWKPLLDRRSSSSGQQQDLWYDNVVNAVFDDEEPFRTIKAMCRLSCSVCEGRDIQGEPGAADEGMVKKGFIFRGLDSLRRHQFKAHNVSMCGLCLKGRKGVFISEQKLYTKAQMHQHLRRGSLEVDGAETPFVGHPLCRFCRKRFYGDNEIYLHMSRDHFTCHICQRNRPGHFEYFHGYDDLEAHFRDKHALCENPECLAKKFVVFPSEVELKRHNASRHGGSMPRSQRNAAMHIIPAAFEYRRRPGQDSSDDRRRGGDGESRGRWDHGRSGQLSSAAATADQPSEVSLGISRNADESGVTTTDDTRGAAAEGYNIRTDVNLEVCTSQNEIMPSRYLAAVGRGGGGRRSVAAAAGDDAAFPPLPGPSLQDATAPRQVRRGGNFDGTASIMAALLSANNISGSTRRRARAGIRVLNIADQTRSPVPLPSSPHLETA